VQRRTLGRYAPFSTVLEAENTALQTAMSMIFVSRVCLLVVILASLALLAQPNGNRLSSLSQRMKCDCGCGDVLGECEHVDCKRRPALKKEISDSILRGNSDDQILQQMAATHGTAILVTPMFQGFNRLLWIVPVVGGILVVALTGYRIHKARPPGTER
jgi:cytochrome c-type biogenesis protein CcmH/NrfF